MSTTISLTEDKVYEALRTFLLTIVAAGTEVVQAQTNRVAPPAADNYVTMTSQALVRLSTNVDSSQDALFVGSIAGTTLTISSVVFGSIGVGSPVFGVDVFDGTYVTALGTGSGGVGTYTVSAAQTVASEAIAAGTKDVLMPSRMEIQLDVHGSLSADNSSMIVALFRDAYGVETMKAISSDVSPLYASDARQIPFLNDSQQIEQRWEIDLSLQVNPTILVPQQYADAVTVGLIEVDAYFPPQ